MTLEFLFGFPVLFIVTVAIFEFGAFARIDSVMDAAALDGVRAVGIGELDEDVVETIDDLLALHALEVGPYVRVLIQRTPSVSDAESYGNPAIPCEPLDDLVPGEVGVTVCVLLQDGDGNGPGLGALSTFGLPITGSVLTSVGRTIAE